MRLQFGPHADLSVARWASLSPVSSAGQILSIKKRGRWTAGEASSDGAKASFGWRSVREEIRGDRAPAAFTIFEHYTGTEWRNDTVSRA